MESSYEFTSERNTRTEYVHLRLTKKEKNKLEKVAEEREISLTDLMRNALQWYLVDMAGRKQK